MQHARTPVLVELFTSEGCSCCPPADAVLSRLANSSPLPHVDIVTIAEHVTYWDRDEWRDRFADPRFDERLRRYARLLGDGPYTPQVIVGGRESVVGSRYLAILGAINRAERATTCEVGLSVEPDDSDADTRTVQIEFERHSGVAQADVMVAITEDGLASRVEAGENAGRLLAHAAVARTLDVAGHCLGGNSTSITASLTRGPDWFEPALRIVAFLQDPRTGAVLAVTSRSWSGASPRSQ
jgi:hypothetical protein